MHDEDQYDLSSEIEEGKREAFIHRCAMRDMDQGIRPTYWDEPNDDHEDEDNRNAPPTHIYIPDGVTAMREVRGAPRRPLLQLAADRARILPRNRAFHNPALAVQGKKRQTGNTLFAGRD